MPYGRESVKLRLTVRIKRLPPPGAGRRMVLALLISIIGGLVGCTAIAPASGVVTPTAVRTVTPVAPTLTPTPAPIPTATDHSPAPTSPQPSVAPSPSPSVSPLSLTDVGATESVGTPTVTVPVYGYRIVDTYPHDPAAFTQGLVFHDGVLYEGTGQYGASSLREVELETGRVVRSVALPEDLFGEGMAVVGDRIVQLTWQSNLGLVYDRHSFALLAEFYYPTEGWGLAYDGEQLVMSDGTATLHFLDGETFEEVRHVEVREGNSPVAWLNELEIVDGLLLANVWTTDLVAMIDPGTGQVEGWIDLAGLLDQTSLDRPVDVLNGIAYDRETGRLFVTGKFWPVLFSIELVAPAGGESAE